MNNSFSLTRYLPSTWSTLLHSISHSASFKAIEQFLRNEYQSVKKIYPEKKLIFYALALTPPEKVKVVILGQDPYHHAGQAHGLAFSVPKSYSYPPSLNNIFKELKQDIPQTKLLHGDLCHWSKQGVLLLNTILTVREKEPGSHQNQGWETFTDEIINRLNKQHQHLVFVLWGNAAKKKKPLINTTKHTVLEAAHPSPLSAYRGFFGCQHFSKINQSLQRRNKAPINWQLV